MKHRLPAVLVAGVAAATAVAAAAATKDAKALALRLSDFPAGTRMGQGYELKGPFATSYTGAWEIRPGDPKREEDVSLQIWVAKTVASAKRIYQQTVASYTGKGPKIGVTGNPFKGEIFLHLPSYGDEQIADYLPKPTRPHGQLIVRRKTVVWYLTVENCTPLAMSCYGTSRTEPPIGQAKATAELKLYGAKQKARVGSG